MMTMSSEAPMLKMLPDTLLVDGEGSSALLLFVLPCAIPLFLWVSALVVGQLFLGIGLLGIWTWLGFWDGIAWHAQLGLAFCIFMGVRLEALLSCFSLGRETRLEGCCTVQKLTMDEGSRGCQ